MDICTQRQSARVHTHAHTHVPFVGVCMCKLVHICTYVCVCVCVYVYMYVCIDGMTQRIVLFGVWRKSSAYEIYHNMRPTFTGVR